MNQKLKRQPDIKTKIAAAWDRDQRSIAAAEVGAGILKAPPSCQQIWFEFRLTHPRQQVVEALAILKRRRLTIEDLATLWQKHGFILARRLNSTRRPPCRLGVPSGGCVPDLLGDSNASHRTSQRKQIVVRFARGTSRRLQVEIRQSSSPSPPLHRGFLFQERASADAHFSSR